jgi:hypothetical protein
MTAMPLIAEQRCNASRPTSKRLARVVGPGVRDVVNCLAVEPEREDGPVKALEAVRTVLGKHALADGNRVQVAVRNALESSTVCVSIEIERATVGLDVRMTFAPERAISAIESVIQSNLE